MDNDDDDEDDEDDEDDDDDDDDDDVWLSEGGQKISFFHSYCKAKLSPIFLEAFFGGKWCSEV